jgi:hypothetical protein
VGFDGEESLFDRIEIRGVGRKKDELALGLIFNQVPNLFGVVDVTVVEYEHAPRARVRVGERNDQFAEKLKESLRGNRPGDNVVSDDAIEGKDWEDGKVLSSNEDSVLNTPPPHGCPTFCSS